jgi:alpha-L-arabinofuranosidase
VNWVIGGWENKQHGIITHYAQQDQLIERVSGSIEDNKWYDVKIVMQGSKMECYLDGKLIQTADVLHLKLPTLYTSATKDSKTGEVILKVVNNTHLTTNAKIKLSGAQNVNHEGVVTELSGQLKDENAFCGNKVSPVMMPLKNVKDNFTYTFKPYSMTVLRVKAE